MKMVKSYKARYPEYALKELHYGKDTKYSKKLKVLNRNCNKIFIKITLILGVNK